MQNNDELNLFQFGLYYTGETLELVSVTKQGECIIRKPNKNQTNKPVENFLKKV